MPELTELLRRVDQRKGELDAHRPLSPLTTSSLRGKLALDWTYNSNAIEGNTLTLRETKVVLEEGSRPRRCRHDRPRGRRPPPRVPKRLDRIRARHGDAMNHYWKEEFGYGIDQLTQAEAGHLRAAASVDAIRTRIAAARDAAGWPVGQADAGPQYPALTLTGFDRYREAKISRAQCITDAIAASPEAQTPEKSVRHARRHLDK